MTHSFLLCKDSTAVLCAVGQMNYIGTRPLTPDAHQTMLAAAIAQLCCCCCSCG